MSRKKDRVLSQLIDSKIDEFLNIELSSEIETITPQSTFIDTVDKVLNLSDYDQKKLGDLEPFKSGVKWFNLEDLELNSIVSKALSENFRSPSAYNPIASLSNSPLGIMTTLRKIFLTINSQKNRNNIYNFRSKYARYDLVRHSLSLMHMYIRNSITEFDYIGYLTDSEGVPKKIEDIFIRKNEENEDIKVTIQIVQPDDDELNAFIRDKKNIARYETIKSKNIYNDERLKLYFETNENNLIQAYKQFYKDNIEKINNDIKNAIEVKIKELDEKIAKEYILHLQSESSVAENFEKLNAEIQNANQVVKRFVKILIKDMFQSTTDPYTFRRLYKELTGNPEHLIDFDFNGIKIIPFSQEKLFSGSFNQFFIIKTPRNNNDYELNGRFGLIGEKIEAKDIQDNEFHCLEEIIYGMPKGEDDKREPINISVSDEYIDTLSDIDNNLPPITYFLINDSNIRMGKRSSLELSFFLKGLSSVELSKASPIFNMVLSLPVEINDSSFGTNYKTINFKNYLGYEENVIDINASKSTNTNSVDMSFFTAPHTLNNFDENSKGRNSKVKNVTDYGVSRLNRIDDITRPLMTVKSFTIDVAPTQGLMSFKTGKLSLVLHDKSRMIDVAALIKPDLLGVRENGAELDIEYGWSSPETGMNNPIGTFLNSLRQKEKYIITNSSFNITQNGEVNIDLSLAMRGPIDIRSVKLSSGNTFKEEVAQVKKLYNDINTLKSALRYYKNKDESKESLTSFLEVNETVISTIYEKIFSLNPSNSQLLTAVDSGSLTEFRIINKNIIREIKKQFKISKGSKDFRKNLATALNVIPENNDGIKKLFDFISGSLSETQNISLKIISINAKIDSTDDSLIKPNNHAKLIKTLILTIYDFCSKVETVFVKSNQVITSAESYVEKLFVGIKEFDPFYDHEITNIINEFSKPTPRVYKTYKTSISVDTYGNTKNSVTNDQSNVDSTTDFVTLGNILTCLIGTQLRNTGGYTDIQIVSYTANDRAGMFSGKNLSSLLFKRSDLYEFTKDFFINNKEVTLEGFIGRLIQEFALVKHNLCYFGTTEKNASFFRDPQKESARLKAIYRHLKNRKLYTSEGKNVFVVPKIKLSFDTFSPKENKKATILRISIYDNNDNPYQDITTLMSSKRKEFFELTEKLARINISLSSDPSSSITQNQTQEIDKIFDELEKQGIASVNNNIITIASKDLIPTKEIIKKHIPSATYGTHNSAIIDASITSINESRLNTVFLTRYDIDKKQNNGIKVSSNNQLPLRVMPASATITTFGCPIINFAQYMFLDFGTETTIDNIYAVTGIKHDLSPGKFTTSITLTYGDIYGKYKNALGQITKSAESMTNTEKKDDADSAEVEKQIALARTTAQQTVTDINSLKNELGSNNYVSSILLDFSINPDTIKRVPQRINYITQSLPKLAISRTNLNEKDTKPYKVAISPKFYNSFRSRYVNNADVDFIDKNTLEIKVVHDFHVFANRLYDFDNNYLNGVFALGGDHEKLYLLLRASTILKNETTLNGNNTRNFVFKDIFNRLFNHSDKEIQKLSESESDKYNTIIRHLKKILPEDNDANTQLITQKKISAEDSVKEIVKKYIINNILNDADIKNAITGLLVAAKETSRLQKVDMHVKIPAAISINYNNFEYKLVLGKQKSEKMIVKDFESVIKKNNVVINKIKEKISSLLHLNEQKMKNFSKIQHVSATFNPDSGGVLGLLKDGDKQKITRIKKDALLTDNYVVELITSMLNTPEKSSHLSAPPSITQAKKATQTNDNFRKIENNQRIHLSEKFFNPQNEKTRMTYDRIYVYEIESSYLESNQIPIYWDKDISLNEKLMLSAYQWGGTQYKKYWALGGETSSIDNIISIEEFNEKLMNKENIPGFDLSKLKSYQQRILRKHREPINLKILYCFYIEHLMKDIGAPYVKQKEAYQNIHFSKEGLINKIEEKTLDCLFKYVDVSKKNVTIQSGWRPSLYSQINLNIQGQPKRNNYKETDEITVKLLIDYLCKENTSDVAYVELMKKIFENTKYGTAQIKNKRRRNIRKYIPLGQGANYKKNIGEFISRYNTYFDVYNDNDSIIGYLLRSQLKKDDTATKVNTDVKSLWNSQAGIAHPDTTQHLSGNAIDILIDGIDIEKSDKTELKKVVDDLKTAGFKYVKFYNTSKHIHVDIKKRGTSDFTFDGNKSFTDEDYQKE